MIDFYQRIEQELERQKPLLLELSHKLHANPEIRFEEVKASTWLSDTLEEQGFKVERGVGNLPTAFKAEVKGKAEGPNIAFLCEYDALEGLGHACGHNVIATMGLGAGLALKPLMHELNGNLFVIGTPGEEGGGGKVILLENGIFDGIDSSLMIHPSYNNGAGGPALARVAWEVRYTGVPAHAAAAPHLGVNALDAVRLAFNGMDALRQQVKSDVRMHAIITEGGDAPNIIPHNAALKIYIRSATKTYLHDSIIPRMKGVFEGAALMTGTKVSIKEIAKPYDNMVQHSGLNKCFDHHAKRLNRTLNSEESEGAGSTDMGNISHVMPSLHAFLAIDDEAKPHTHEFAQAARSERGDNCVVDGATILASIGLDIFSNPGILKEDS